MPDFHEVTGPPLIWIPRLTLIFLLWYQPWRQLTAPGSLPELAAIIATLLAAVGLFVDNLAASPWLWFALTASHCGWLACAYFAADNHQYLIGYWLLTISVALIAGADGTEVLARNATLLLGLCFALATASKAVSRRYRDGSFFTRALVLDLRFLPIATWVAGVTEPTRLSHIRARDRVIGARSSEAIAPVSRRLRRCAMALTWWTLAIEAAVAIAFLSPSGTPLSSEPLRATSLLLFVITTFVCVPVPAFGQILLIIFLATTTRVDIRIVSLLLLASLTVLSFVPTAAARLLKYRAEWLGLTPPQAASVTTAHP
jgi:hypothetical protein